MTEYFQKTGDLLIVKLIKTGDNGRHKRNVEGVFNLLKRE